MINLRQAVLKRCQCYAKTSGFEKVYLFDEVLNKYKEADIIVLPCVIIKKGSTDITPNTLFEAMVMKLPVISTNISPISEIIKERSSLAELL